MKILFLQKRSDTKPLIRIAPLPLLLYYIHLELKQVYQLLPETQRLGCLLRHLLRFRLLDRIRLVAELLYSVRKLSAVLRSQNTAE